MFSQDHRGGGQHLARGAWPAGGWGSPQRTPQSRSRWGPPRLRRVSGEVVDGAEGRGQRRREPRRSSPARGTPARAPGPPHTARVRLEKGAHALAHLTGHPYTCDKQLISLLFCQTWKPNQENIKVENQILFNGLCVLNVDKAFLARSIGSNGKTCEAACVL